LYKILNSFFNLDNRWLYFGHHSLNHNNIVLPSWNVFWGIIAPIIVIVLVVLLIAAKGVIPLKKKILPETWIVVLIVGIVVLVLLYGSWFGWGVLGNIGEILLIVSALVEKFT
ncbi:MAG: hypothetical protein RBG13Loki_2835, partial [Promethearchaeota archaeon CR_4]